MLAGSAQWLWAPTQPARPVHGRRTCVQARTHVRYARTRVPYIHIYICIYICIYTIFKSGTRVRAYHMCVCVRARAYARASGGTRCRAPHAVRALSDEHRRTGALPVVRASEKHALRVSPPVTHIAVDFVNSMLVRRTNMMLSSVLLRQCVRSLRSLPDTTGPARGLASRDVLRGASLSADACWLRSARYGSSLEPSQPRSGKRTRWVGPFVVLIHGGEGRCVPARATSGCCCLAVAGCCVLRVVPEGSLAGGVVGADPARRLAGAGL